MIEGSPFDIFIGIKLGNYHLEQMIAQNKWGPIFRARARSEETYIIRFIVSPPGFPPPNVQSTLTTDERFAYLRRFQREASLIGSLQHPSILPLLDYGDYQGLPYLVYPDVPLVPLRALLGKKMPTDTVSIGRYLYQIASTLEYAHQHAILHRNLSSEHIFMQSNRRLLVGEFGLMRLYELGREDSPEAKTQPYSGGSEASAPEQWLGKPVSVQVDIYALGALLYQLLTGHPPFEGTSREEIARQHLYAKVSPLSTWRTGLPIDLDHIIAKAMAKEPAQRYRLPSDLVQAYYQIVAPQEMPGRSISGASGPIVKLTTVPKSGGTRPPIRITPTMRQNTSKQSLASRRRLMGMLATVGGIGAVVAAGVYGLRFIPTSSKATKPVPTVLARVADVPVNSAKSFPLANHTHPGLLIRLTNEQFVAFDSTCTHAGCAVAYSPDDKLLKCPCHGAIFDPSKEAAVVQGPASTPIDPHKDCCS